MAHNNTVFAQLLKLIPRHEFESLAIHHYRAILSHRIALVSVCDSDDGAIIGENELA